MKLSIVIPFRDEAQNVRPVLAEVRAHQPQAEIVAIDDGSSDETLALLRAEPGVEVIALPRPLGQSAALYCGLRAARGDVLVTMDGDGQTSAADIKRLLSHIPRYDFVNGRRVRRNDPPSKVAASWVANWLRDLVLRDGMRDAGGSPKAMKRECVDHLVPFDGMHRFIPSLLVGAGYRSLEIDVEHRERLHGRTKYTNAGRALRGLRDLVGMSWWLRRRIDTRSAHDPRSSERARIDPAQPGVPNDTANDR